MVVNKRKDRTDPVAVMVGLIDVLAGFAIAIALIETNDGVRLFGLDPVAWLVIGLVGFIVGVGLHAVGQRLKKKGQNSAVGPDA